MNRNHLKFPPPPVPRTVRESLKDYPELIEDLQDGLAKSHYGSLGAMSLDSAVWLLKDMLLGHRSDAHTLSDQAKVQGNLEAARRADEKAMAISMAIHSMRVDDLQDYFRIYDKEFQ